MKSNFPGIQFRVLTVYTETGDFEVPYSKEQKQSNRRPGTERVPAFDPKIEKVLFSKRKDGYLVAIGCCKNGCPPSGVEAIPVDGIWSDIIPVMVSKMILPLYTRENDPKFTNYFCQHGFETTTFSNPTIPDGC